MFDEHEMGIDLSDNKIDDDYVQIRIEVTNNQENPNQNNLCILTLCVMIFICVLVFIMYIYSSIFNTLESDSAPTYTEYTWSVLAYP
jgi:heme/copper-type cytochrome/quinol oxidase subunit 2